jgi:hypothetical protein
MEIKTKDLAVFYMNPDGFHTRRETMENRLSNLQMNYERVPSNSDSMSRIIRMNEGLMKMCMIGMQKGSYPFLMLEDDALDICTLPDKINVPEEAKLIYWGISLYNTGGKKKNLYAEEYNKDYYRVYHSLATHAILIPNASGGQYLVEIIKKAIEKDDFADMYLAIDSDEQIILTPKDGPYFCQDDAHTRPVTDFKWKNKPELIIEKATN